MHVADAKRGKTRTDKSRLVLFSFLILITNLITKTYKAQFSPESGARFFSQPQIVVMQNQSNCEITFDT